MGAAGYPEDMLQKGYSTQWGPDGRDDLGAMRMLGANAVRLYHSMGAETKHDHGAFLDRAAELGLRVMPGMHSQMSCPDHDCYDSWKAAVKAGFQIGYQKDGEWHPAIDTIIIYNEPDFTPCTGNANWCRVKRVLSALEGILDAEKEMKVKPGKVRLSVTWSFGMHTSVDGKVTGAGYYGFQDMVAGTADPSIAHYMPKSSQAEIAKAFEDRWIHGMNTQAPWNYVKQIVASKFSPYLPKQWFIGEYGANGQTQEVITADLRNMDSFAQSGNSGFLGVCFFQFQTAYIKGGTEMNFGLFSLGTEKIGDTGDVCEDSACHTFPVYCLDTTLEWFEPKAPALDHRAEAAAKGWGGSAMNKGRCKGTAKSIIAV